MFICLRLLQSFIEGLDLFHIPLHFDLSYALSRTFVISQKIGVVHGDFGSRKVHVFKKKQIEVIEKMLFEIDLFNKIYFL